MEKTKPNNSRNKDRTEHPLTKLTNSWRQAVRKVESLTDEYNKACTQAALLREAIDIARGEQKAAWDAMAGYKGNPLELATPPSPVEAEKPA